MTFITRPSVGVFAAASLMCASMTLSARQPRPAVQTGAAAAGMYTDAQALRGAAFYAENCAQCHEPDLKGGDLAPALAGPGFLARWATKPLAELYDYLRTQMPLNSPGGLSDQQNADLLSFLLQKSGYASGKSELPASGEKLAGMKLPAR